MFIINRWVVCVILIVLVGGGVAHGQPTPGIAPPPQRPTISPYLNLLRDGGSPALNYFGLVRPEQQFRQSLGTLQGAVPVNQQAIGGLQKEANGVSATGHPAYFLNTGGYFQNMGGPSHNSSIGTVSSRPTLSRSPMTTLGGSTGTAGIRR